jgi:hypothetical protein
MLGAGIGPRPAQLLDCVIGAAVKRVNRPHHRLVPGDHRPSVPVGTSPEHSKVTNMKSFFFTTLTAGALASAALGLAGTANAAPSGPSSVDQTVSQLRSQGYQVIVNRVGTAPLDRCTISAVRPGQTFSHTDSGAPGAGQDIVTTVTDRTVYVDVAC